MAEWVSVAIALLSLVVSVLALTYTRRVRLTVAQVERVPGGYGIGIVNAGEQSATHVAVRLVAADGTVWRAAGTDRPLLAGERVPFEVAVDAEAAFPLRIVMEHRSLWGRREKESAIRIEREARERRGSQGETDGEGRRLTDRYVLADQATPDQVWARLTPHTPSLGRLDGTWADKMRVHSDRQLLGEVRSASDWARVPESVQLYAVAVREPDGVCVRWARPDAAEALAGGRTSLTHRHVHRGEGEGEARKGYVTRLPSRDVIRIDA